MRVALLVGTLMFSMVFGFYEIGVIDMVGSADNQGEVQACDDAFPPPPSWP